MIRKIIFYTVIIMFSFQFNFAFARNRKPPARELATPGTGFNITEYLKSYPKSGNT